MRRTLAATLTAAAAAAVLVTAPDTQAEPPPPGVNFRIATQAPEGTVWMEAMEDIKRSIEKGTKGRVRFTFFPNGSQGDEKAVIERMDAGLIHGGLFTGIGLGQILPEVRILELPFVYESMDEIVAVRTALEEQFKRGFDEAGYVFLGWAEVGWAYVFSKVKAADLDGLRARKIWVWAGDPLAEHVFSTFELNGVPLALTDVLTSLETGMIDSVYNSPYGLVGLQWHRDLRFMSRMTVGHGTGALLVSKSEWQKIPPAIRDRIAQVTRRRLDTLLDEVRTKNEETIKELEGNGMQVVPIPQDEFPRYVELGNKVADDMVGRLYDQATLDTVRQVIARVRAEKQAAEQQ